jgi:hypothetical protein
MQATIPDERLINGIIVRLTSTPGPSDIELKRALSTPEIGTGLDHWAFWTLICLHRHLDRQKWVSYIVESRLKGDLRQIGCAGAFDHPEALPQSGEVPGESGWRYYFHGCGCCLTNAVSGASIDVDFTREGESNKIDRFFYSNFLLSIKNPDFPEQIIRREEPFQHAWQVEVDRLSAVNCIETGHGTSLTTQGVRMAEAFESLVKQIGKLVDWATSSAFRNAAYAALELGDIVLASRFITQTDAGNDLKVLIQREAERAKQLRLQFLSTALKNKDAYAPSYLSSIADLGPELSEGIIVNRLVQSPVDGGANTALEILRAWNRPNLVGILKDLLRHRYSEATGLGAIFRQFKAGKNEKTERQPRNYQVTQASLALLQRTRFDSLDSRLKKCVRFLIENAGGAQAGEAALLLYLVDRSSGLDRLRQALSGKVPAAHKDAAAACVIIGNQAAKQILKEALENPERQIQHVAACALIAFPAEDANNCARHWFARNDGIKEPLGKEVTVLGRTGPVFTFEDISHVNMDAFFKWSLEKLRKDFKSVF